MKFDVLNRFTGAVQFTAEIDCAEDAPISIKLRLAVLWGITNGSNLCDCDLSGSNLSDCDMSDCSLRGRNLRLCNGSDRHLRGSNLSDCDLRGSNLRGSNLRYSNLRGSNLRDCDLRYSNLIILQTDIWTCYIQLEHIRIGCQYHRVDQWLSFSDEDISKMDSRALDWWSKWKALIMAIHSTLIQEQSK